MLKINSDQATQQILDLACLYPSLFTIKRGPSWEWGNQDSNTPGKITDSNIEGGLGEKWVNIVWFNNHGNAYRISKPDFTIELKKIK